MLSIFEFSASASCLPLLSLLLLLSGFYPPAGEKASLGFPDNDFFLINVKDDFCGFFIFLI